MPGPQVSHRRALAEKRRAGHARPLPGCSRRHELAGTHICVPYKLSGNTRVVYRGENTVGAGHARPLRRCKFYESSFSRPTISAFKTS